MEISSDVAVNDITEKSEISIIGTEKHSIVLNSAYNQVVEIKCMEFKWKFNSGK